MIEFGKRSAGVQYIERIGAYAVIPEEPGVFVVIRTPKGYFLPGGGLHAGESPEEASRRETLEETGYDSVILSSLGSAAQFTRKYRKIGHFFIARTSGKVAEAVETDHELFRLPTEDAIRQMRHEYHAWAIREALTKISTGG